MKLVTITGTNAKHSYNRKLLQFMAKHFTKKADIEVLDIDQVPMFDETDIKQTPQSFRPSTKKLVKRTGSLLRLPNTTILYLLASTVFWNGSPSIFIPWMASQS